LKRRKKFRDDLAKQGFLSVFDFLAHVKARDAAKNKAGQCLERATEIEQGPEEIKQESEESAPEEIEAEPLTLKRVGQVSHWQLLMHSD